jgi:hypothetical protein
MTDHYDMPQQSCPVCSYRFDAATLIEGDGPPEPENLTLCIKCGSVLQWDYAMRLRKLTAQELRELSTETFQLLARAQRTLSTIKAERN